MRCRSLALRLAMSHCWLRCLACVHVWVRCLAGPRVWALLCGWCRAFWASASPRSRIVWNGVRQKEWMTKGVPRVRARSPGSLGRSRLAACSCSSSGWRCGGWLRRLGLVPALFVRRVALGGVWFCAAGRVPALVRSAAVGGDGLVLQMNNHHNTGSRRTHRERAPDPGGTTKYQRNPPDEPEQAPTEAPFKLPGDKTHLAALAS